jgi:hypothetical protein
MSNNNLERRIESLEQDRNGEIGTWVDLTKAVAEGRDPIHLSPEYQGLFEQLKKEGCT